MGSGASKKEEKEVVRVDGISEVDQSMNVINVHSNIVMYMSTIFLIIVGIMICVYIYFRHGGFCCSCEPLDQPPPAARSRRYVSNPRSGSVIELVRLEDGDNIMKTFAVEAGNKTTTKHPTLSTLLQPMREMEE